MHSIIVRNVPMSTLRALKRLARSHNRSLQEELCVILDQAAQLAPACDYPSSLELVTVKSRGSTSWGRDETYGNDGR